MADDSQYRDSAPVIKPIETEYRGHRFRSRLEARWAVFFDTLGLPWEYEPEGFEKDGDRYLPDFRITLEGNVWWVEVKGDQAWLDDNRQRVAKWLTGEPIVPGGKILLLGQVPEPKRGPLMLKVLVLRSDGPSEGWVSFEPWQSRARVVVWPMAVLSYFKSGDNLVGFQPFIIPAPGGINGVKDALTAARKARFEHGESGAA